MHKVRALIVDNFFDIKWNEVGKSGKEFLILLRVRPL